MPNSISDEERYQIIKAKTRESCQKYRQLFTVGKFKKDNDTLADGTVISPPCELRWQSGAYDDAELDNTTYGTKCLLDGVCYVMYNNDIELDGHFYNGDKLGYISTTTDVSAPSGTGGDEEPIRAGECGDDDRCQRHVTAWEQSCLALRMVVYELRRLHRAIRLQDVAIAHLLACREKDVFDRPYDTTRFVVNPTYVTDIDRDNEVLYKLEDLIASSSYENLHAYFNGTVVNFRPTDMSHPAVTDETYKYEYSAVNRHLTSPTFDDIEYLAGASLLKHNRGKL